MKALTKIRIKSKTKVGQEIERMSLETLYVGGFIIGIWSVASMVGVFASFGITGTVSGFMTAIGL